MPYALAIHTSSADFGLAIAQVTRDRLEPIRSQTWDIGRELSSQLPVLLGEFLPPQTWQDFQFLAVAKGPGSFTGTRIGVVTARTIAQQLEIPLFAISSLAAIAHHTSSQETIAVQMRAQRGEIFGAIYPPFQNTIAPHPILSDTVMTQDAWQTTLTQQTTPYTLAIAEGGLAHTVVSVLTLAHQAYERGDRPHWSETLPFYGQHPVEIKT